MIQFHFISIHFNDFQSFVLFQIVFVCSLKILTIFRVSLKEKIIIFCIEILHCDFAFAFEISS
uniref:CSON010231 protein n=1 Tax=Culicoides sonorensis TaxID=179676 RepID=A0A336M1F6_CULSO